MAAGEQYKLEASVPTGLEVGASEECAEVLGRTPESSRGRLTFSLKGLDELQAVDSLRSVDNFWVVVDEYPDFCKDESSVLERLNALPLDEQLPQWDSALRVWRHYHQTIAPPAPPNSTASEAQDPSSPIPEGPRTFRVTCTRVGRKHGFTSMEAAAHLGGSLAQRYGWKVQMKNADLEVLLNISGDTMSVGLALNKESKYRRNITHFGPTTLRSTIAYGLLRMASIEPGDVVVDPLCGAGSISIEGSFGWRSTFHLAGDLDDRAPSRTLANLSSLREKGVCLPVDVLQWDACRLPLKTNSVDVFVTDLPFGKRSGCRRANWILYPGILRELGRVCRPVTARAVLLTHDNKAFSRALQSSSLWKRVVTRWINIGGLTAAVYVLLRNSNTH